MSTLLVGPIVGPVSATTSDTGTLSDLGQGVDFAIGGLGFKLAINDERPYERATAKFRKEQFDSTPTVGDQSLVGYWTRGQLTFHKGAGVKYYETMQGEEVLDRFHDSQSVAIGVLGEVTLTNAISTATTATGIPTRMAAGRVSGGSVTQGIAYKTTASATTIYVTHPGTGATDSRASAVGTVYSLATGQNAWQLYAGGATGIEDSTAGAVLHTYTGTSSIASFNLFYGKQRLWATDGNGRFYHLPTSASSYADADSFWRPTTDARVWSFADAPNGVYFGDTFDGFIYHVTITNEGGATPTLTAGRQVYRTPRGETLRQIVYYLGMLVIVTSKGFRLAAISDTGDIVTGPLTEIFQAGAEANAGMLTYGNSVYIVGRLKDDDQWAVVELDLSQQTSELVPAWNVHHRTGTKIWTLGDHSNANGTLPNIVLGKDDSTVDTRYSANLASTGYLTTGYHRFGTLEPKRFHSVRVRTAGDGGTVAVSRVMSDGSVISLITIDVLGGFTDDITLGMSGTQEMIGLKFTLSRSATDATKGPTLLGYQLRALPAPARQRMLRVPLSLFDVERSSPAPASGYQGSAWARLEALEDMERDGGTFQFQDFRTGEAGECYIESVEHQGKTPPGRQGTGFGGIVWLTLRKL